MNGVVFEILRAVIALAVILVVRYAIPCAKGIIEESKYSWIVTWVDIAVRATEQTMFGKATGSEKKAAVVKFIKNQLAMKNIKITDEQLDKLIEAAVFEMNGGKE